jgi:hypothetical protein
MPIHPIQPVEPKQYFGKYRGLVLDNVDPLQLGRILAQVGALPISTNWAMPCLPYIDTPGVLALPPVGTGVWIEFEEGNLDYPIWSGCFWNPGQPPLL